MKSRLKPFTLSLKPLALSPLITLMLIVYLCAQAYGQEATAPAPEPPELSRSIPAVAGPGTSIELEGYRMGAEVDKNVRLLFVQGGEQHLAEKSGSGWVNSDLKKGLQQYNVKVPEGLVDGPCQIIVEVAGVKSQPLTIEIKTLVTPPVLVGLRPHYVLYGEMVWIDGTGYSEDDTIELTDSNGKTHDLGVLGTTSSADTAAFPLPADLDLPEGEASIRAVEQRSGLKQRSNSLSFIISRDPVPLVLSADWLRPVAPGQWLDLTVLSFKPIERAERIEVRFKQNESLFTSSLKKSEALRVLVPASLAPGTVEIDTRTWIDGNASAWSDPISYKLLERAAAPQIFSLQLIPERAEAAILVEDKIVATVPLVVGEETYVLVPEKISPGSIKLKTRTWRAGRATPWSEPTGFTISADSADRKLELASLNLQIYTGPEAPPTLVVHPGESMIVTGQFPVSSVSKLEAVLESSGRIIRLPCIALEKPWNMKITIPRNTGPGDWSVSFHNSEDGTVTNLPTRLRIR